MRHILELDVIEVAALTAEKRGSSTRLMLLPSQRRAPSLSAVSDAIFAAADAARSSRASEAIAVCHACAATDWMASTICW